jgi:hypothetical protein
MPWLNRAGRQIQFLSSALKAAATGGGFEETQAAEGR